MSFIDPSMVYKVESIAPKNAPLSGPVIPKSAPNETVLPSIAPSPILPTGTGGDFNSTIPNNTNRNYKRHELSALFPEVEEEVLANLADDIRKNGLLEPIWLYNDQVLDGWNRYQACLRAKVNPVFEEFTGNDSDALIFVVSKNIYRRHLKQ